MLRDAKFGDVLLIDRMNDDYLTTVTKVTKTLVYCGATKYNRQGRQSPRQKWDYTHARIATAEDVARVKEEIRRQQCIHTLLALNVNVLKTFSTEKLSSLVAALEVE